MTEPWLFEKSIQILDILLNSRFILNNTSNEDVSERQDTWAHLEELLQWKLVMDKTLYSCLLHEIELNPFTFDQMSIPKDRWVDLASKRIVSASNVFSRRGYWHRFGRACQKFLFQENPDPEDYQEDLCKLSYLKKNWNKQMHTTTLHEYFTQNSFNQLPDQSEARRMEPLWENNWYQYPSVRYRIVTVPTFCNCTLGAQIDNAYYSDPDRTKSPGISSWNSGIFSFPSPTAHFNYEFDPFFHMAYDYKRRNSTMKRWTCCQTCPEY